MKITVLIFGICLATFSFSQWTQIGEDINGEAFNDRSGCVSISDDGMVVAIGAYWNNDNGTKAGHVRVYEYNGSNWIQKGNDIDGDEANDNCGKAVSISADGNIVAVGIPLSDSISVDRGMVRVYKFQDGDWIQLGNSINGENSYDNFGYSVSLNSNGTIVAIGAIGYSIWGMFDGLVNIYNLVDSSWIQMGESIVSDDSDEWFGYAVDICSDGQVVVVGAPFNDDTETNCGEVTVFSYDGTSWIQKGNIIHGTEEFGYCGSSVSINSDGTIIAYGAPNYYETEGIGYVIVNEFIDEFWTQKGSPFYGAVVEDWFGASVSLNQDGSVIAIGAPHSGNESWAGVTKIFRFNDDNWFQVGSNIEGEIFGDLSGNSVSINSDGSVVAIGAPDNFGSAEHSGHVRVYGNPNGIDIHGLIENFSIFPNPTTGRINIVAQNIKKIEILNIWGQIIQTMDLLCVENCNLNITDYLNGLYLIKITTSDFVKTYKIIKR